MTDPGHSQILQLLVGDTQQLVPPYLLPLKGLDVLLEAVIQAWWNHTDRMTGKLSVQHNKATFCLSRLRFSDFLRNRINICIKCSDELGIAFLARTCTANLYKLSSKRKLSDSAQLILLFFLIAAAGVKSVNEAVGKVQQRTY